MPNAKESRSSRPEVFCKQGLLEKFAKFAGPEACDFVKKRLQYSCFPANLVKFLS